MTYGIFEVVDASWLEGPEFMIFFLRKGERRGIRELGGGKKAIKKKGICCLVSVSGNVCLVRRKSCSGLMLLKWPF